MKKTGTCKTCGEVFEYESNKTRKYCSPECKNEAARLIKNWSAKKRRMEEKERLRKSWSNKEFWDELNASGLTYGQFVAEQTKKSVRVERNGKR